MVTLTLAISGSGGAGAISTGEMLLASAARSGYYGMLKKTFSPQIRGGEAAAILRLGTNPVATFDDTIDILIALDWENFARFADEVPISANTLVIQNQDAENIPDALKNHPQTLTINAISLAASADSNWFNMVFLGMLTRVFDCNYDETEAVVIKRLAKHGSEQYQAACRALKKGNDQPVPEQLRERITLLTTSTSTAPGNRLLASGNQMTALGALEAGVRFAAAYPITPASDLLEFLARHIEPMGGTLLQAEDELAAINMTIGAGFGGVPALTATSGPGLALMVEGMGLAVASETPTVVIDVMRGGPSTGIPTKSEQSDFNLAVYGLHGDAPHVVVASNSISDCHFTTAWAVALAGKLQTLAIVLSDQFLGQSQQILDSPEKSIPSVAIERPGQDELKEQPYWRYRDTESGISPMALPGEPGCMFTADGLEHKQNAVPSPSAEEHRRQLDKRLRKLRQHDFGLAWADLHGLPDGNPLIVCWGSVTASAIEAQSRWSGQGRELCVLSLRLLSPLQTGELSKIFARSSHLLVAEQNHGAQFFHYLRAELPEFRYNSLARPGPRLLTAADILEALEV